MIRFPIITATLCMISLIGIGMIFAMNPKGRGGISPFQAHAPAISVSPLSSAMGDPLGKGRILRN